MRLKVIETVSRVILHHLTVFGLTQPRHRVFKVHRTYEAIGKILKHILRQLVYPSERAYLELLIFRHYFRVSTAADLIYQNLRQISFSPRQCQRKNEHVVLLHLFLYKESASSAASAFFLLLFNYKNLFYIVS